MRPLPRTLLTAAVIAALALACFARGTQITGKIVAYDVMRHASKNATALQNEETVILAAEGRKEKFVKVMFASAGTTQIDPKYFDGSQPMTVDVFRDRSCDEKTPIFVPEVRSEQIAGTYLLTDAFKAQSPGRLKTLDCYVAIYKKKK